MSHDHRVSLSAIIDTKSPIRAIKPNDSCHRRYYNRVPLRPGMHGSRRQLPRLSSARVPVGDRRWAVRLHQ